MSESNNTPRKKLGLSNRTVSTVGESDNSANTSSGVSKVNSDEIQSARTRIVFKKQLGLSDDGDNEKLGESDELRKLEILKAAKKLKTTTNINQDLPEKSSTSEIEYSNNAENLVDDYRAVGKNEKKIVNLNKSLSKKGKVDEITDAGKDLKKEVGTENATTEILTETSPDAVVQKTYTEINDINKKSEENNSKKPPLDVLNVNQNIKTVGKYDVRKNKIQNLDFLTNQKKEKEKIIESKVEDEKTDISDETKHVAHGFKHKSDKYDDSSDDDSSNNKKDAFIKKQIASAKHKLSASELSMLDYADDDDLMDARGSIKDIIPSYGRPKKIKNKVKRVDIVREKIIRTVMIPDFITVQELANRMSEKSSIVIKELMKLGIMATLNQSIDADTAELIVTELGHNAKRFTTSDWMKQLLNEEESLPKDMQTRPPVVTIMGHVDHGKTSLLDALRLTDVASDEHGGITQHIGAYMVTMSNGKSITFLDTPGHEAFTAMRMRGAKVTDIVVIVIAANDGIKAQTIEAINHARAAETPIIVAVNKMDLPDANIAKVQNELLANNLIPEELGGNIMLIPVSAHKKTGLDKLEEAILFQADLLDLKADYNRGASGSVIEAKLEKTRGSLVTFLVQQGTLRTGDIVVAGSVSGKVRSMHDDKGHRIAEATPSTPVEISGLSGTPVAGDDFIVLRDEKTARDLLDFKIQQEKEKKNAVRNKNQKSLEQMFTYSASGVKSLPIIIKGDVQGSVEAIVQSIEKLPKDEVQVNIVHAAVGGIIESDIALAMASKALILGFNVRANVKAKEIAKAMGIEIRYYSIIYDLLNDIKVAMSGLLSPITKENTLGTIEIRKVFNLSKYGKIAGCYVLDGVVKRGANMRLLRDNIVIHEGKIKTLKREKEDAREVKNGFECGITVDGYDDVKPNDIIEVFELIEEKRELAE